ncbi:MAG: hypothetical protein JSV32_03605, partial [Dehalococcoidia bacterium]
GDEITLTGSGFPVSSELYVFFARQQADVGDEIDVEVTVYSFIGSVVTFFDGRILGFPFNIPTRLDDGPVLAEEEDVFGGNYYVYVTYENSETIRAVTSVRVLSNAAITGFNPNEGIVGTEVEISGEGFVPGEAIIIEYDGEEIEIDSGDEEADNDGEFTLYIIIPDSEYGKHTVTIKGEDSLAELAEIFTIEPEIRVNIISGEVGTEITITGTGFDRRNGVNFSFGTTPLNPMWLLEQLGRTNPDGTFIVQITVPDVATGSYIILAEDEDDSDIFATETFEVVVNTAVNVSPTTGFVGDSITIVGSSFGAGATATIYFDDEELDTAPIGIDGSFTANIDIPKSATGTHTIRIEDTAGRSATATVSVEPEMTVSPTSGIVGDTVNVSGRGFSAEETITILYGNIAVASTTPITTDSEGTFSGSFYVPSISGGVHAITVTDGTSDLTTNFTVLASVIINPTSGQVGDGIGIAGQGFGASKNIAITYGNVIIVPTAPIIADPSGMFSGGFIIPAIPGGAATLNVSDGISTVSINLTISASLSITPTSGGLGDNVGIIGYGFGANKNINILIDGQPVTPQTPITSSSSGNINGTFNIPAMPGGAAVITINDGTITTTVDFTVETSAIDISQETSPGYIGMEISFSGDGYAASAPIEVIYDGTALTVNPDITGDNGSFVSTFIVPKSTAGEHTIVISINGIEVEQFTFVMESNPPQTPRPLLPYLDSNPEQPVRFDWEDVTDEQNPPVTYSLEIAIDSSFANKVIDKTGLVLSEYTINEAEQLQLESIDGTGPFYWHVKAIDNVGNESFWSGSGTFHVGGGWPSWLMWLWIGLGGLAVFIFALWLGRRVAYSSY